MEHNDKFPARRQKLQLIRPFYKKQGITLYPVSNGSKVCIPAFPLEREVMGIPQILARFRGVSTRLHGMVSWLLSCAHCLPKSVARPEVTILVGQLANKLQTRMAVPANRHERVHSRSQRCLPFATYLQVASLVKSLNQGKLIVRAEAARKLGELGKCAPVEPLLDALDDEQRFVRAEAARALGKLGKRVPIDPLIKALHDKDGSVRVAAAQALGMLGGRASLENLLQALNDPWPPVREAAVLALGRLEEPVSLETFLPFLQDEDKFVRAATLSVLGGLGEDAPIVPTSEDEIVPETASRSKQHFAEIVAAVTTDGRNKYQVKSIINRFVAWQFAQVHMPIQVRQNKIVYIIVGAILCMIFMFPYKKRIVSIFVNNTSRIFRFSQTSALGQKGT